MTKNTLRKEIEDSIHERMHYQDVGSPVLDQKMIEILEVSGFENIGWQTVASLSFEDEIFSVCMHCESGHGKIIEYYDIPSLIVDSDNPILAAEQWKLERDVRTTELELAAAEMMVTVRQHKVDKARALLREFQHERATPDAESVPQI